MLGKLVGYLYQTVRFLRSSTSASSSVCRHRRSTNQTSNLSSDQHLPESTESIEPTASCEVSTETDNKMKRRSSTFDELCKDFEIRIENSVKVVKDKMQIKSKEINETIVIDDDIEEEFCNLIKKNKTNDENKRTVKLFGNVTNRLQNVDPYRQQQVIKKKECSIKSTALTSVDLNKVVEAIKVDKEKSEEDLKAVFKNLKPENYRIQQVIKLEDLVFFDLETGGMGSKQDILQIGAINHEGKKFNMYATPTQPIPGMSSRIHHITFKDNQMFYRKNPVKHCAIIEVLLQFCDYLNQMKSNNIVLVAHNANFDRRFLIEKMFLFHLQGRLNAKIAGFLDTLPLFRQLIPGRESYKQDRLVLSFFPQTKTDFHNALTDVIYLKKLFISVTSERMKSEFKYINGFTQSLEYGFLKKEQQMFEELGKKKPAAKKSSPSKSKKRKAANSGIYIDGEPVKRTRSARKAKTSSNQPTVPRSTRKTRSSD